MENLANRDRVDLRTAEDNRWGPEETDYCY